MTVKPRPRHGTPKCARPGCGRWATAGCVACSQICMLLTQELDKAARVHEATGDARHLELARGMNRAVTAYFISDHEIYKAARASGFTNDQWRAIKFGDSVTNSR